MLQNLLIDNGLKEKIAFQNASQNICYNQFLLDINILADTIATQSSRSWALCYKNSYAFAVALFAILQNQGHPILLPNYQSGTIESLRGKFDAILSDMPLVTIDATSTQVVTGTYMYTLRKQQNKNTSDGNSITLYTSGSTTQPKKVIRTLEQMICEIEVLEHTFGHLLGNATIYATVSHQHIYGLLFYILWPLHAGRIINFSTLTCPENVAAILNQKHSVALITSPSLLMRMPPLTRINAKNIIFSSGGKLTLPPTLKGSIFDVLGSTETSGVAFRKLPANNWTPLSTVNVQLDKKTQCLKISSPFSFCSQNGFIMGDMAQINTDGSFQLLDRTDRIVKIEGKRCSLVEIEALVKTHKFVKDAYVLAMEANRQYIAMLIVLTAAGKKQLRLQGKKFINSELKKLLTQYVDAIILPKQFRYTDAIPVNTQGKRVLTEIKKLFTP